MTTITDTKPDTTRTPLTKIPDDEAKRIVERILNDVECVTSLDVAAFNSSI